MASAYEIKKRLGDPVNKHNLQIAAAGFLFIFLLWVFFNGLSINNVSSSEMADFHLLGEVDVSTAGHEIQPLGRFLLQETAIININYNVPALDIAFFDLRVIDQKGRDYPLIQTNGLGNSSFQKQLQKGSYQVLLTAQQSRGKLTIFWGYH